MLKKPKGQTRMDNPEKLATLDTQDEDKHTEKQLRKKPTHNTICDGHHYSQTKHK